MASYPEIIQAELQKRTISASFLVFMDFRLQPRRWWMGTGILDAGGHEWIGMGNLIQIEGLGSTLGMAASETTFTLSGVDPDIVALVRASSDRVKDRRVRVFLQFFSGGDSGQPAWTPLDQPISVWSGRMDQMKYAGEGPSSRTVTLTAESLWTNRNRPPFGRYTDGDQKARHPGDRGLEQVASLTNKTIRWIE